MTKAASYKLLTCPLSELRSSLEVAKCVCLCVCMRAWHGPRMDKVLRSLSSSQAEAWVCGWVVEYLSSMPGPWILSPARGDRGHRGPAKETCGSTGATEQKQ